MIKAVIFDFFDVFRTDAYKTWLRKNNIAHEGAYFEASRLQDVGEITTDGFLAMLSKLQGRTVTFEEVDGSATVDHEVVEIADALRKHYRLALLSNASSAFLRQLLHELKLDTKFDEIVISSEVGVAKPSAEIFEITLKKLGVDASEVIFVDDNERHTQAAEKLGIKSIIFSSASQLKQDLEGLGLKV
ncbi:MAG TPA: HAD family phosphatase [Patescibacteria group bacterium]|nr:HAD family phosphatase [Patescibacteria group bacterium]